MTKEDYFESSACFLDISELQQSEEQGDGASPVSYKAAMGNPDPDLAPGCSGRERSALNVNTGSNPSTGFYFLLRTDHSLILEIIFYLFLYLFVVLHTRTAAE